MTNLDRRDTDDREASAPDPQSGPARGGAHPRLSVIIPVRNERERLPTVIDNIEAQTLRPDEVIVVDGASTDGTREWLAAQHDRPWLRCVPNERRIIPVALNLGIRAASGDLVARMDAHADYPADYLQRVVELLTARPEVAGTGSAMTTAGRGAWGRAIASVMSRKIGLGGARHRVAGHGGPIEHVFTGCYRRGALLDAGGYDERLLANEDYEMDYRLRAAGATVWLHPDAHSTWYVRDTPGSTVAQMYRYGFYKALTMRLHPRSLKARQLAPPGLIVSLAALGALGRVITGYPVAGLGAAYLVAAGTAGALAARADGVSAWRGAVVPPLVHLSWGAGVLAGSVRFAAAAPAVARTAPAEPGTAPEIAAQRGTGALRAGDRTS